MSWAFTPPFPPVTFPLLSLLGWGRDFPLAVAIPPSSLPPSLSPFLRPCLPASLAPSLPPSLSLLLLSHSTPSLEPAAGSLSQQVPSRPDPNPPLDKAKPIQFSSALASPAHPPFSSCKYSFINHSVIVSLLNTCCGLGSAWVPDWAKNIP